MGKPWEDYKDKIEDYYIKQNLPLKVVQQRLLQEDGFEACKRAFQNQIEAWGFRKNVRSHEMQLYVDQKRLRKSDSEIDLPEETKKIITPRKARRFEKRSEGTTHSRLSEERDSGRLVVVPQQGKASLPFDYYGDQRFYYPPTTMQPMRPGQHGETLMTSGGHHQATSRFEYGQHPHIINLPSEVSYSAGYSNSIPATTTSDIYPTTMFTSPSPAPGPLYDLTGDYPPMGYEAEPVPPISIPRQINRPAVSSQVRDLEMEMFNSCYQGSAKDLVLFLHKGADPNATTMTGDTPLLAVVKGLNNFITSSSASPSQYRNTHGALYEYNRCLSHLLSAGADPHRGNLAQEYPLQLAVEKLSDYFDSSYETDDTRTLWADFLSKLTVAAHKPSPSRNGFY